MCLQRGGTISSRRLLPLPVSRDNVGSSLIFPFNDKVKGVGIEVLSKIRAKGQTFTEKRRGNHAWSTEHKAALFPNFSAAAIWTSSLRSQSHWSKYPWWLIWLSVELCYCMWWSLEELNGESSECRDFETRKHTGLSHLGVDEGDISCSSVKSLKSVCVNQIVPRIDVNCTDTIGWE